jgi:ABC-type nitrate/sulfonate/bicarbonate transport system substrate-binding protein
VAMNNPSELFLRQDLKYDLAYRPMEMVLLDGKVDAIWTGSKQFQHLQEATGKIKIIDDLMRYPDWTLQVAYGSAPGVITCTEVMANEHPELCIAYLKAMIKVGRWANEHKHAAAAILNRQTFYLDVEDTYEGIKHIDLVPNLGAQSLKGINIAKDWCLSHGYIKNDFDVSKWAAPEFLEKAAQELIAEQWKKVTAAKLPEVTSLRLG